MPKRYPRLLVQDMLACIDKIQTHLAGLQRKDILADSWMCDAIVRNLELIGEACNQMPVEIKRRYPEIPWRKIVDFRNRVIHQYADIDMELVLDIIDDELPNLKQSLQNIFDKL